jgi:ATP-binding cassette subfamily B protein
MAMTNARVEFSTSMVSFERVFEVLDMPVEIEDQPSSISLPQVEGWLRFKGVSFSYDEAGDAPIGLEEVRRFSFRDPQLPVEKKVREAADGETRWALSDIDFEIKPGQVAALVGPSGAGKSTLTYLVPRLYDPTSGQVLLDGHNVAELKLDSLARNVGMVTQETYLFHASLRENLLYADAEASHEAIVAACKAANIHDFIDSLPEKYDTLVGERGYRLSGGERQRVAIARVLLKNPKILILDEATSHLDSQSEALIQEAMETVMEGRTSLVIAHRLSTIVDADLILVMDQGRLVETGRHDDLLAAGGLYASLYETQFSHELRPA